MKQKPVWKPSHTFNSYTDSVLVHHSIGCTTIKQIYLNISIFILLTHESRKHFLCLISIMVLWLVPRVVLCCVTQRVSLALYLSVSKKAFDILNLALKHFSCLKSILLLAFVISCYAFMWKIVLSQSSETDQDHIDFLHYNSLTRALLHGTILYAS